MAGKGGEEEEEHKRLEKEERDGLQGTEGENERWRP